MRSRLRILTSKGDHPHLKATHPSCPETHNENQFLPEMEKLEGMQPLLTEVTGDRMLGGRAIPLTPKLQTPKPLTAAREWLINKE